MKSCVNLLSVFILGSLLSFLVGCSSAPNTDLMQKRIHQAIEKSSSGIVCIEVNLKTNNSPNNPEHERVGCGVIADSEGTIVTTYNLIKDAKNLTILFQDGCQTNAQIIGYDHETNLAILNTTPHEHGCFPIPLKIKKPVKVGEIGLILGNSVLTKGISTGWGLLSQSWMGEGDHWSYPLLALQSNEIISHTGSAIVDLKGNLIGILDINYAGHKGVWMVITASTIKNVKDIIKQNKTVPRGWLGLICDCEYKPTQEHLAGVRVLTVAPHSPAEKAGIKPNYLIKAIDDVQVSNVVQLRKIITSKSPNTLVKLDLLDDNDKPTTQTITLTNIQDEANRFRRCNTRSL